MQDKLDEAEKSKERSYKEATKALSDAENLRKELSTVKGENTKLLKRVEELGREIRDLKLVQQRSSITAISNDDGTYGDSGIHQAARIYNEPSSSTLQNLNSMNSERAMSDPKNRIRHQGPSLIQPYEQDLQPQKKAKALIKNVQIIKIDSPSKHQNNLS